ncbi:MAG TPA: DUF4321 domain-containing protein [Syntrophomonadaceae bacterium]|nr:DUF4321 domain-containing protein [Syntrophomonadaceae bacterium]
MVNREHRNPTWQVLLILLCVGGIAGAWIGELLEKLVPSLAILGRLQTIGVPAFTLDLKVFAVTFGFTLHLSLFTLLGFALAYLVYRRL